MTFDEWFKLECRDYMKDSLTSHRDEEGFRRAWNAAAEANAKEHRIEKEWFDPLLEMAVLE